MSVQSFEDSDDDQREPVEEVRGPSSDVEIGRLLNDEIIRQILLRKRVLPWLPWIFGAVSVTCLMMVITGYSLDGHYLESITEIAKLFSWLTFISILLNIFGDSIVQSIIGKLNN